MVTSKKRQDLRIQLLKRAKRRTEKKLEYLEDDRSWKEVCDVMSSFELFVFVNDVILF